MHEDEKGMMTFGGHLEVFRKAIIRILIVTLAFACVIYACKGLTFSILLGPSEWDFCTYRWIEGFCRLFRPDFGFEPFRVEMIATELSSQFMTHLSTSVYLGLLCASPFILFEIFRFVSPALLESEKRYSVQVLLTVYALFLTGVLMSYFVLFPVSFRFLGTYSVADKIHNSITLDSYISTFTTLTLLMGLVFQLPVAAFVLGRMHLIRSEFLSRYRRQAFVLICLLAAIITPPDLMTLILVAVPLYALYEVSIAVVRYTERKDRSAAPEE